MESVRVVVKCRPMNQRERGLKCDEVVSIDGNKAQCTILNPCDRSAPPKTFTFDGAYGPDSTNEQIYADVAFPLVDGVTEGYNGTVFAYGQTGCGKTYTIQGCDDSPEQRGVVPRAIIQIFDTASVADSATRYLMRASYLEIYNEEIRDLLGRDTKVKLELREHSDGTVFVKDLSKHPVFGVRDCEQVMERGWKHRSTGATLMNVNSSRSHSIFTIYVERCDEKSADSTGNLRSDGVGRIRASKLNLVDLAGSERQSKTGATGDRQREAAKINLSLSALGNVISALVDGRSKHIPYRDSKLTRLLQDSLGGNTKTLMIACVSPAADSYDETLSTLRYANRAKNIRNKPMINEDPKDAMIRQYIDEINRLKAMLSGEVPMEMQQQQALQAPTPAIQEPEPKIVERIVRVEIPVVDEAQIIARTNHVVEDYETRMRHLAAELAEAQAGRQRTADEMARLRADSEESQHRLRDQLAESAESERRAMRDDFERETSRLRAELEATRASRNAVQSEADGLRERFRAEMRRVEGSLSAERVEEEKRRLVEEYEQRMCRIQGELETVRNSRRQVDEEMARLQATYEAKINALQAAATVTGQTVTQQPYIESRSSTDHVHCEDNEDCVKKPASSSDKEGDVSGNSKLMLRCEPIVESLKITLNARDLMTDDKHEDRERCHDQSPTAANVQKVSSNTADVLVVSHQPYVSYRSAVRTSEHQVGTDFDSSMNRMTSNLEAIRQMRDNLNSMTAAVKIDYQNAVQVAQRTFTAGDRFECERKKIKAEFDVQMELVRDDVDKLNVTRQIMKRHIDEKRNIRDCYLAEVTSVNSRVEDETVDEETAILEVRSCADKYFELSRQLEQKIVDEKENAEVHIIDAKYEREKKRVGETLQAGTLTDEVAREMLEQLNVDRLVELARARDKAIQSTITPILEDLDVNDFEVPSCQTPRLVTSADSSKSELQQQASITCHEMRPLPVSPSSDSYDGKPDVYRTGTVSDRSSQADYRQIRTSAEVTKRLKELERAFVVGGGGGSHTTDGGTTSAERRQNEIRERLKRQKRNAEEKQHRLQQAQKLLSDTELPASTAVIQEGGEDGSGRLESVNPLKAGTAKTIETLRAKCKALEREIRDLYSEFQLERMDFLDTIRNQDQTVRWYEAFVGNVLPTLSRNVNYADLEKIRSQSRWDDLNQTWILPRFEVDRRLSLPPLPATTVESALSPTLATVSTPTLSSDARESRVCSATSAFDPMIDYELRSEDRFLQRLNESVQRNQAASYFRTGTRADQLMMLSTGSSASPVTPQIQHVATTSDAIEFRGGSSSSSSSASGSRVSSCSMSSRTSIPRFDNKTGAPMRLNAASVNARAAAAAGCLLPGRQRSRPRTLPRPFQ